MKTKIMCNGWISPFNLKQPLGKPREQIYIGKRINAVIEAEPEDIEAIREGIIQGWHPEFWIMEEVIE